MMKQGSKIISHNSHFLNMSKLGKMLLKIYSILNIFRESPRKNSIMWRISFRNNRLFFNLFWSSSPEKNKNHENTRIGHIRDNNPPTSIIHFSHKILNYYIIFHSYSFFFSLSCVIFWLNKLQIRLISNTKGSLKIK